MLKVTQKELKNLVATNQAVDLTRYTMQQADELRKKEGYLTQIGYASGLYGCNGKLLKGNNTNTLYAITARTNAIYMF